MNKDTLVLVAVLVVLGGIFAAHANWAHTQPRLHMAQAKGPLTPVAHPGAKTH